MSLGRGSPQTDARGGIGDLQLTGLNVKRRGEKDHEDW